MTDPSSDRIFGLTPRARKVVAPLLIVTVLVIAMGTYLTQRSSNGTEAGGSEGRRGPVVGGDLHAVGQVGDRLFVGGHGGAGYRNPAGGWTQIESLNNKDVMGWAQSGDTVLAGGHEGLYASTDDGSTFDSVSGLPVSDVHGVGASGRVVYVASPQAGILVSEDGGTTFERRSSQGMDFMGTIWVDPSNPDVAIAPSMQAGAARTTDGGRTWDAMGGGMGSMSVAVGGGGQDLFVVGMGDAQVSTDMGSTWTSAAIPDGTSAASYTAQDKLVIAVLDGDRATVYQQAGSEWEPLS
ncbi:WD40/YVTN/BNR-like repeat-containing protein [Nocardioides sp. NPDC057772]|uniref:WD40/YVTN/BNR-like repeat-containing protein n=1 Tax=unclassified Nocardioides TaxID=2615069 RepID=UPI0002028CA8|nr:hypothetical protein [Nocardioides sp. NBC_00368]EGD42848.1 S-layer repressor [Nocardioidaceae bacterium Broad-1]